jgi:Family of unknown function (DUF6313)
MADVLIPRLAHLCSAKNGFRVATDFVERFVKQHEDDWGTAESHWEYIVARVLNTDAVDVDASRQRAIHQAVAAAVVLLDRTDLRERCPVCPSARPSARARLHKTRPWPKRGRQA